jgi:hypothetical protein
VDNNVNELVALPKFSELRLDTSWARTTLTHNDQIWMKNPRFDPSKFRAT